MYIQALKWKFFTELFVYFLIQKNTRLVFKKIYFMPFFRVKSINLKKLNILGKALYNIHLIKESNEHVKFHECRSSRSWDFLCFNYMKEKTVLIIKVLNVYSKVYKRNWIVENTHTLLNIIINVALLLICCWIFGLIRCLVLTGLGSNSSWSVYL